MFPFSKLILRDLPVSTNLTALGLLYFLNSLPRLTISKLTRSWVDLCAPTLQSFHIFYVAIVTFDWHLVSWPGIELTCAPQPDNFFHIFYVTIVTFDWQLVSWPAACSWPVRPNLTARISCRLFSSSQWNSAYGSQEWFSLHKREKSQE